MSNFQGDNPLNCNRRDFMKYAGLGAAALSIGGMALSSNAGATSMSNINSDEVDTDVLIVGGGVTATFAAVKAREQGVRVTLVDKGYVGRSGLTPNFHGFAYNDPKVTSPEDWLHGFMWATEGMTRKDYVDMFLEDSKARWEEISSWVPLESSKTGKGPYLRAQIEKSGTQIIEGVMITELLEKNGRVVGAIGLPRDEDKAIIFRAGAVILCNGAGSFKLPGWPAYPNTFDGQMMAYKLGAQFAGKEWNDFHGAGPTTSNDSPGSQDLKPFRAMQGETAAASHNLRSIFWTAYDGLSADSDRGGGEPTIVPGLTGDAEYKGSGRTTTPTDSTAPPARGGRPEASGGRRFVPGSAIGAGEHRMDGIFPKDDKCWTGVDGLWAAGDAMCTGGVGTAGSSSPGCAVQAARAAIYAAEYTKQNKKPVLSKTEISNVQQRIFGARSRTKGYSPQWVTRTLQATMMPYYVLYVKKQDRLEAALTNVLFLKEHFVPRLIAKDPHELRLALETENLILNAEMKLRASMFRKESRHSHFREDFPFRDDKNWLSFVVLQKDGDKMDVKKWDLPKEWIPASWSNMSYEEKYTYKFPGEAEHLKQ